MKEELKLRIFILSAISLFSSRFQSNPSLPRPSPLLDASSEVARLQRLILVFAVYILFNYLSLLPVVK